MSQQVAGRVSMLGGERGGGSAHRYLDEGAGIGSGEGGGDGLGRAQGRRTGTDPGVRAGCKVKGVIHPTVYTTRK